MIEHGQFYEVNIGEKLFFAILESFTRLIKIPQIMFP